MFRSCRVGWHPGAAEQGVVHRGYHVGAVLGGGGQVAADGVSLFGGLFGAEPSGDLLLGLGRADVAFGLVVGGRDVQIMGESQHVVLAVAQHFQQNPPDRLSDRFGWSGDAADLGQTDADAVPETLGPHRQGPGGDGVLALLAGEVGGVDQAA
jgi:hypothetical protein